MINNIAPINFNKAKLKENTIEQRNAILLAQNGDKEALSNLIEANEALIMKRIYALGFNHMTNDIDDLIQEGKIGLIEAINRFDLSLEISFSTYAVEWIDNYIRRCKQNYSNIYIPEYKKYELIRYKNAYNNLQVTLGRNPKTEELAIELGISETRVIELAKTLNKYTLSLDAIKYDIEDREELQGYITLEYNYSLDSILEQKNFNNVILDLILNSNLTDEEIIILLLHFGIETPLGKKYILEEIGDILGFTRETVRIKEKNALGKLIDNPCTLELLNHSQNPDLVLRKMKIKKILSKNCHTNQYSDFYSFFPEYTKQEIKEVIKSLSKYEQCFLETMIITELKEKYTKAEVSKLYDIICLIYDGLLEKFGRRSPIDYMESSYDMYLTHVQNQKGNLDKLHTILKKLEIILKTPSFKSKHRFYDCFPGCSKELIDRSLMYISQSDYEFLQQKYGEDFGLECNSENNKLSKNDVLSMRNIIDKIKKIIIKLQNKEQLFTNVYLYFNQYSENLIDKVLQKLSESDKALLHKRFGSNLKVPHSELQLVRLTNKELIRLSLIIKTIDKILLNESNLESVGINKNLPRNPYTHFLNYDKNMITYAIVKLTDVNREILLRIFGNDLTINFNKLKYHNINEEDIRRYEKTIIAAINKLLNKINTLGIETILTSEKEKNKIPKFLIKDIYALFPNQSIKELNDIINNLFKAELEILQTVFGLHLDSENYIKKLKTLSLEEQLAFYGVINKIANILLTKEKDLYTDSPIVGPNIKLVKKES